MDPTQFGVQKQRVHDIGERLSKVESRFEDLSRQVQATQLQALQAQIDVKEAISSLRHDVLAQHNSLHEYVHNEMKPVVEDVGNLKGKIFVAIGLISIIVSGLISFGFAQMYEVPEPTQQVYYVDPRQMHQRSDTLRTPTV